MVAGDGPKGVNARQRVAVVGCDAGPPPSARVRAARLAKCRFVRKKMFLVLRCDRVCGHTFITNWLSNTSTIVDLGMNHGDFSFHIAKRYGSTIIGVEPVSELFVQLPRLPHLVAECLAISGHDGMATLSIPANSEASSLTLPQNHESLRRQVPVSTLTSLLQRNGINHVGLLKADIEGAEIAMFDATDDATLKKIGQISVEFHDFVDHLRASDVLRIKRRLSALDFSICRFSRDNTDVLFVNQRLCALSRANRIQLSVIKYHYGLKRIISRTLGRMTLQC